MYPAEIRDKAIKWLKTPPGKRVPRSKAELCRKLGITSVGTLADWKKRFVDNHTKPSNGENYNSISYLLGRLQAADEALLASCLSGNAAAQKVLRQILGQMKDSPDKGDDGYNADEIARIRNEARRELEKAEGSGEVRPQPDLLPSNIREDS